MMRAATASVHVLSVSVTCARVMSATAIGSCAGSADASAGLR
jgi:hypothetical protein